MTESVRRAVAAAIHLVPQWSLAEVSGSGTFSVTVGDSTAYVFATQAPSKRLDTLVEVIEERLPALAEISAPLPATMSTELVQRRVVQHWLEKLPGEVAWNELLGYVEDLGSRTYENDPVGCNIVVTHEHPDNVPEVFVTDPIHQKVLDPLAGSPFSYLRVTSDLRFVSYDEIPWNEVSDERRYEFYPGFLRPLAGAVREEEYAVHRTSRGDIVIQDQDGMIASRRKGRWRIYEMADLQVAAKEHLNGKLRLAQNLLEVALSLSFKRHGALLVYDPGHRVVEELTNGAECRMSGDGTQGDACRQMLASTLHPIALGAPYPDPKTRRRLLEASTLDGAVIFDDEHVLAIGAMIRPHENVPPEKGARSTAALSALWHQGHPIKISADGDITFYTLDADVVRSLSLL